VLPSLALAGPVSVTSGATLLTVTLIESVSLPPSSSSTLAETIWLAKLSAQVHLKEPDLVAGVNTSSDFVPLAPQLVTCVQVSAPGSVNV
jgi:hypothetical protein